MTYYNYLGQAMAESASGPFIYGDSSGNETLTAPAGPSGVSVNGGNFDTLIGSNGDNTFDVNNSTDVVQVAAGLTGIKTIVAFAGGYTLPNNVQNLTFYGAGNWGAGNTAANLVIMGSNDHATLDGGGGNDVLMGGDGENDFQLEVGLGASNHDVFYNFHAASDTVRISGASFTSFAQIQADMQQVGSDVVLTIDANDSITFRDTTIASFQASNFLMKLDTTQLGAMTFSDNFTSLQLFNAATGTGNWQTNYGGDLTSANAYFIQGNDEKQLYTAPGFVGQDGHDLSAYNPFSINNGGGLSISAGQFSYADSQYTYGQAYYSGMLNTRGVFMQQYGYFDMKAELPTNLGSWPAFWLSQDPYKPGVEADVMEHLAMYPDIDLSRSNDGGVVTGHTTYMPALSGFHDYGMLWTPTTTTFYVDDLAVMQVATPASWDQPMYMLLDMALGGWGGPVDESALPAQMQVQYVHVYGLAESPVVISEGEASYTAAAGVSSITLIGSAQTVHANNGGMSLVSNDTGNHLIGGTGSDTITLGAGGDTATGGGGNDTFALNAVPTLAAHITDFSAADTLDLTGLLQSVSYSGSDAVADGVVKFTNDSAGDAQVWIHSSNGWSVAAVLNGVAAQDMSLHGALATDVPGSGGSSGAGGGSGSGSGGSSGGAGGGLVAGLTEDFNGDGLADIAFRDNSSGLWGFMTSTAGGEVWHAVGSTSVDYNVIGIGDFDGAGHSEIAFRQQSTGDWGFMSVTDQSTEIWHPVTNANASMSYAAVAVGDYNGDGAADIAFRNPTTGDLGFMSVNAVGQETWTAVGSTTPSYAVIGSGDFNGDGIQDIAFRDTATGNWGYMSINGANSETWHPVGYAELDYAAVGVGDYNGDGSLDIAFRSPTTGDWGFMSLGPGGSSEIWHAVGPSGVDYNVIGSGDYGGDGKTDLAFRQASTGDWGYMELSTQGMEVWHPMGQTSTDYFSH